MTSKKTGNDDKVIELKVDDLTLNEIELVEDLIEAPFDSLQDPKMRKAKMLKALAAVTLKRDNPSLTTEEALAEAGNRRIKFAEQKPVPPTNESE